MTKTKILSVFTIVAVAAMMGVSAIAPAYAAQKIINEHEENEILAFVVGNPCGDGDVLVTFYTNEFIKAWDNDKFKFHSSAQFNLYAIPSLELVGTVPVQSINIQGDLVDLPISGNFNAGGDGECLNGTTFPASPEFHCGNTLQKDGDLIDHSVSCI